MDINIEQEKNQKNEKQSKTEKLIDNEVTEKGQNQFLQTTLGKTINTAIDIGLRTIMPSMVEEQIIDIKNVLLTCGLKEGINTAIKNAIDFGKSTLGIVTGKFENLSQVHNAVKKGGIIDGVSDVLDNVVNSASKNKLISKGTARFIKKGKNAILDTVSNNIEDKFLDDVHSLEKVSKYISNWKYYYNLKDLPGMEKEFNKLKKQLSTVVALESTISEAKQIENLHNLIKNKGINYRLSEEEKKLIEILK